MATQLNGERFKTPVDLQPFVPKGTSGVTDLTETELETLQTRVRAMMHQLAEVHKVLEDEKVRRERESLVGCCDDWQACFTYMGIELPKLSKNGKGLSKWRRRVALYVSHFAEHMKTRKHFVMKQVSLKSAKTVGEIFSTCMPALQTLSMVGVACPGEVPNPLIACFPLTLRQLTLMRVAAKVELGALAVLTELRTCVIDGMVTGKIDDIGDKDHLVRLTIHAHVKRAVLPKDQRETLGRLVDIPKFPKLQHLELRACGLTGKIDILNKFSEVALLNLDNNPIDGNLLRLRMFKTLQHIAIRNTRIQAKKGAIVSWAAEHPQLESIQTEGSFANIGSVFFQTKGR